MSLLQKPVVVQPIESTSHAWMGPRPPVASRTANPDAKARTFLLQPWVTIRASASSPNAVKSVTQDDALWMDLRRYPDAAFWLEVSGVTPPSAGSVLLNLESSPTLDECDFRPIAPPVTLAALASSGAVIPTCVKTVRTPSTVPLSRYTRWRLSVDSGATGVWDASFRIRGVGGYSSFILPTQLAGLKVWLRGDLGITKDGSSLVSTWADQSGNGNDATSSGSARPTWDVNRINGQPTLNFNGTANTMSLPSLASLSAAHVFVVHKRATAYETQSGRTGFWRLGTSGLASHMPWTDNKIYDDGGSSSSRYVVGDPASPPVTVALDVAHVYEVRNTSGAWDAFLNGVAKYGSASNTVGLNSAPQLGADTGVNVFYYGDWAEFILYDRILSVQERALLIDYLNGRYGLGFA